MREQMRSNDRALSNIESHPEGYNHLRRMYENVQVSLPCTRTLFHLPCKLTCLCNPAMFYSPR